MIATVADRPDKDYTTKTVYHRPERRYVFYSPIIKGKRYPELAIRWKEESDEPCETTN